MGIQQDKLDSLSRKETQEIEQVLIDYKSYALKELVPKATKDYEASWCKMCKTLDLKANQCDDLIDKLKQHHKIG